MAGTTSAVKSIVMNAAHGWTATMKNDDNLTVGSGSHSIRVTTEMTTDVIAGYKAHSLQDIVDRISALERIQPSQLYKVENCPNCGGSMKLYAEEHILKCRYCKSVCFVGIKNING